MRLFKRGEDSSSSLDLLVVGLGNLGREHARNRHNVGWMVVDELASRHGGGFKAKLGQFAEVRDGELDLAAEARALHEPVWPVEGTPFGSSRSRPSNSSSSTTRATRPRPPAGAGGGLAATTGSARLRGSLEPGLPPPAHRGRSASNVATRGRSRTTYRRTSTRTTTRRRSSPALPMPSRPSPARVSSPRSVASTRARGVTMNPGGTRVPSFVMDRPTPLELPVPHPLLREVEGSERLREFAQALPVRASRLGAATRRRGALRGARARARRAGARGRRRARLRRGGGLVPGSERSRSSRAAASAGSRASPPPPHLVGERARSMCSPRAVSCGRASAAALAERIPPRDQRPEPIRIVVGAEPGVEGWRDARARGLRAEASSASTTGGSSRCAVG